MNFQRRLQEDFLTALNALYQKNDEGMWWRRILEDKEIFVAIRDNAIDAYFRGCCLANISYADEKIRVRTHFKYLIKPKLKREYIESSDGRLLLDSWQSDLRSIFSDLTDLSAIKNAAKPYAGGEKASVAQVIKNHTSIIDVEIALTERSLPEVRGTGLEEADAGVDVDEAGVRPSAKRLDIATARQTNGTVELSFYEAKLFTNVELRTTGSKPRVVEQIDRYESLLTHHEEQIINSYRTSSQNLIAVDGIAPERKKAAEAIVGTTRLSLNKKPFLIITEYDADQKAGNIWSAHLDKIRGFLGGERVLLQGKATGIKLPI